MGKFVFSREEIIRSLLKNPMKGGNPPMENIIRSNKDIKGVEALIVKILFR
jgi:hypothetical protein